MENNGFYLYAVTRSGNWYRCRICGNTEKYIPARCPICNGKRTEPEQDELKTLTVMDLLN